MNDIQNQAIEKIEQEAKNHKGNRCSQVVCQPTAETLKHFCESSEAFARTIVESDKTLTDCLNKVIGHEVRAMSDFDVYKAAVQFYFPTADIKFDMRIILSGEDVEKPVETVDNSQEKTEAPADQSDNKIISLFDIL